jgi:hypothetical protein
MLYTAPVADMTAPVCSELTDGENDKLSESTITMSPAETVEPQSR